MRILVNGEHVGYTRSFFDLNVETPDPELAMSNNTLINFHLLGTKIQVQILSEIILDSGRRVKEFLFITSLDNHHYRVKGRRQSGETYALSFLFPEEEPIVRTFTLPADAVIFSPAMELSMRRLKPGQTMRIRTFDPVTSSAQMLRVKAVRKEEITVLNETQECVRLQAEVGNVTFLMWTNARGDVVRQETPFGWTMEQCTQYQAMDGIDTTPPTHSMISPSALAPLIQMLKPSLETLPQ